MYTIWNIIGCIFIILGVAWIIHNELNTSESSVNSSISKKYGLQLEGYINATKTVGGTLTHIDINCKEK